MDINKIFCIGFHKTGTTSLAAALQKLGYRVRHGYKPQSDLILKALHDKVPPLQYLEEEHQTYDAYADLYAIRDHFVELDKAYPDSKFILTVRDEDEWVESVKRQIKKRPDSPFFHHWYYQNELQWRHFRRMHERCVLEYFDMPSINLRYRGVMPDRRLLVMDITKGDGWNKLCEFLNKPIPDKPFPHKNKS